MATTPAAAANPVADAARAETRGTSHLLVRAGEVLCALPLHGVRRVVRALPTYPLPGAAPELLGLAEFAGEPLPVLDLGRLLSAPPGATPTLPVTVVVWVGPPVARELVGLAADEAREVIELPLDRLVAGNGGLVRGEISFTGEAIRVFDLDALGGAGLPGAPS